MPLREKNSPPFTFLLFKSSLLSLLEKQAKFRVTHR